MYTYIHTAVGSSYIRNHASLVTTYVYILISFTYIHIHTYIYRSGLIQNHEPCVARERERNTQPPLQPTRQRLDWRLADILKSQPATILTA